MAVAKKRKAAPKKKAAKKPAKKKVMARKPATKKKAVARRKPVAKKTAKRKTTKKASAKKKPARKTAAKRKTVRKAAPKKTAKKAAPKRKPAKKAKSKRKPSAAFMRPMELSDALSAVVGMASSPRTEVTKKLWHYIKRNGLQDAVNRRMINADDKLKKVFGGKSKVSMFEMTKLVSKHMK